MTQPLQWGILGTGNIANQFARGLAESHRNQLAAVASRTADNARRFAAQHHAPVSYAGYDDLLADPQVQAVYICLPNSLHHHWTLKALRAGKHVLCEKPAAVTVDQAQQMFDLANKQGLVLVEAFMYRSHPQTHAILHAVRSGDIGQLRLIRTSFCFRVKNTQGNIRFDPELAGGSLMDIGCYCLDFSCLLAEQTPDHVIACGHLHPSGVDDYASAALHFPSGVLGSFACGMDLQADNAAHVCGTEGYLTIPWPWKPQSPTVEFYRDGMTPPRQDRSADKRPARQTYQVHVDRTLYALEADDFAATVLDHAPPAVTAEQTINNTHTLVQLRTQLGLRF